MTTGLTNFLPEEDSAVPLHLGGEAPDDGNPLEDATGSHGDNADGDSTADSWRGEVAARLQRYRTRRKPSGPRYPSLLLPFDPPEYRYRASPPKAVGSNALDLNPRPQVEPHHVDERKSDSNFDSNNDSLPPRPLREALPNLFLDPAEVSGKIIEFPRSAAIPEVHTSDLADPVIDRPRIVEAPEVLPPPPALGGMLIEPARNATRAYLDDLNLPSVPASIPRRVAAASVDAATLGSALAALSAIFLRLNPTELHAPAVVLAGMFACAAILAGMAYVFLFMVYTGSTPGLRAAKLNLTRFDGMPASRNLRRWRVLASFLSTFSAGLGFVWCFLDENRLCWHDRITRTYLRAEKKITE
jgi:uncharacterized RDD family membrane protein YckC